ncbi:uncharacterized protein BP5553_07950 [Venustampulla echinocandica]|uniref:Autophagy-related protein 28 n=1 Tax=Venustampulla echinocandica TaxID=2656787 RepID=A0A370TFB1_9HELO|nr:uncharacterized protein BP5553_07950 [Venustampulla echinocandica]RDL33582.1 hypothetical protein BP5553_07950 [Venustampulla echinocandica]
MSRSSFFSRSPRDRNPLLPQHSREESYSLRDLSPRGSQSPRASPSPPPSFYRSKNNDDAHNPSTSRSPGTRERRIQFAAPPPPIATSVVLPPVQHPSQHANSTNYSWGAESSSRGYNAGNRVGGVHIRSNTASVDPLLGLERREKAIHQELQMLLDAQSAGLVQGFGGEVGSKSSIDGSSDAGSSTPTSRSAQRSSSLHNGKNRGIVPVRQPKKKQISLRGARRGLLTDMEELVGIKTDEVGILTSEIETRNEVLKQVDVWEKRIEGARKQLSRYSASGDQGNGSDEEARELAELRTEEQAVDNEIREVEERLAEMKARKRWLGEQIQEGVNRQEAKLSSYQGALKEAESEVKQFLKRPPVPVSVIMGNEAGFMALPSSRRTLSMAREWWNKELSQLHARKQDVGNEKAALDEGAQLWQDAIQVVTEFEDGLRKQMASGDPQNTTLLKKQIGKMGDVISKLEKSAATAEERGWNLLICAIGAELEAFREGEGILQGALEATGSDNELGQEETLDTSVPNELSGKTRELNRDDSTEREDSEDDGPNLEELLVEHGSADETS